MSYHFGNSVQDYYLNEVRRCSAERQERFNALKTKEDCEKYILGAKEKIQRAFNLPKEKTPLKTQNIGTVRKENYTIEKIIYHSRPDFPVTANLYLPDHAVNAPAVIFMCGHSQNGKAFERYQYCALGLVSKGFVVLVPDPIGQGERYQFLNTENNKNISGFCCNEHNMLGKQMALNGDYFGAWRVWDAIRGVDYLESRPEVDRTRIGAAGISGGGTLTTFLTALDSRISMAAPSCYVTTWLRNVENELPVDTEQVPPFLLKEGLEIADFLIASAPHPLLITGQRNDFFDPRGTAEAYEEVKKVYTILGHGDAAKLFIGNLGHCYLKDERNELFKFMCSAAGLSVDPVEHGDPAFEEDDVLSCAKGGQVDSIPGAWRVRDFIRAETDALKQRRPAHSKEELRDLLMRELGIGKIEVPYCRILRPGVPAEKSFSRFGLETEPGNVMSLLKLYAAPQYFHIPLKQKIELYIPHLDSAAEMPEVKNVPEDRLFFGLDVRGIGEMTPSGCDQSEKEDFFAQYRFDYHYASIALLTGKSYLGGKVRDILCAIELLKQREAQEIHLRASGQGCVPALLAAFLSDKVSSVVLSGAPESWESMVREDVTMWPFSCMIRGILKETDLPEIASFVKNLSCEK